ncbi:restriction endonuclease [Amycolatopsis sp. NPDC049688]|uniref:restriction endonuclease n=1 Tax=Amycolatopsis sp. NPDC049688 TaxID=3154733 RepID=UPI0034176EB4
MTDETVVDRVTAHYPPADITPDEFEGFVVGLLRSAEAEVDNLIVTSHEKIEVADGVYDFDATVRYEFAGMEFLILVEAKRHKNPVKRELVAVLYQKVVSVGAHKGVMISTAPYQSGAVKFAKSHGIALMTVTEGRFTFETKNASHGPSISREEAVERFNLPVFVGHVYGIGENANSTNVTLLSEEYPRSVAELLLGVSED